MPLQNYNGYTVDYRLRQFRMCPPDFGVIEFIDFRSEKGDAILSEMLEKGLVPYDKMHYCV
jgi:hypothetical protein